MDESTEPYGNVFFKTLDVTNLLTFSRKRI